jgi:hypothetical protein
MTLRSQYPRLANMEDMPRFTLDTIRALLRHYISKVTKHPATALHFFKVRKMSFYYSLLKCNLPLLQKIVPKVAVPSYRVSQMVAAGGNILDAYGLVYVVSPCGLPMRGIVGISPDPIMFVAINCASVQKSRELYEQLGFVEQVCCLCPVAERNHSL